VHYTYLLVGMPWLIGSGAWPEQHCLPHGGSTGFNKANMPHEKPSLATGIGSLRAFAAKRSRGTTNAAPVVAKPNPLCNALTVAHDMGVRLLCS
jgi:hypothetical protein